LLLAGKAAKTFFINYPLPLTNRIKKALITKIEMYDRWSLETLHQKHTLSRIASTSQMVKSTKHLVSLFWEN